LSVTGVGMFRLTMARAKPIENSDFEKAKPNVETEPAE